MGHEIKDIKDIIDFANNEMKPHDRLIIDETISLIEELNKMFGPTFFLAYTNSDEKYIGIHRDKCERYKNFTKESKVMIKKYKTYTEAYISADRLCSKIQTDVSSRCTKCRPEINLQALLKSINNIFFSK